MRVCYVEMRFVSRNRLAKCISESQIGRGVPFLFASRSGKRATLRKKNLLYLKAVTDMEVCCSQQASIPVSALSRYV
ncbi:hypothetical protein NDU88_007264 [Pleurodeles waltl]|uniref:Uncharacterized protein n=1 Tax=Pleurodeles waltl TaxID=8319 RepID=A0AAV7PKS6_PLEWA|nr:hypothetical protein NDU88_007264 [Pleurodeles waltl]